MSPPRIRPYLHQLLTPRRCACCAQLSEDSPCEACSPDLQLLSLEPVAGLTHRLTLGRMEDRLRDAILAIKFGRQAWRAISLGKHAGRLEWPNDIALPLQTVIPVPLSIQRLRSRGYNQAALLAEGVACELGLPVNARSLVRLRHSDATQARRKRSERHDIVHDYRCRAPVPRSVLLVDDVTTTGATLEACAHALRAAGARRISAFTLASVDDGYPISIDEPTWSRAAVLT